MHKTRLSLIIAHVIGWVIFLSLPLFFLSANPGNRSAISIVFSFVYWLFCFTYISIFYLHSLLLMPQFYLKKKYIPYCVALFFLFIIILFLKPFDQLQSKGPGNFEKETISEFRPPPPDNNMPPGNFKPPQQNTKPPDNFRIDIISMYLFFVVIALSFAITVSTNFRETEQRLSQAEADKTNAELSFLKAQINPHFLFNTLNNIYTLAVTKNENVADAIMKLSGIMRYVTDEIAEEFVPLEDEVRCVTDYIDLQRLRLGKKVTLDYSIAGNMERKKIAPLIFMTLVENVFKYGISNHEESEIAIKIFADEKTITFFSNNKIFSTRKKAERTGIGLSNTKKRLEHSYAGKYFLNIKNENQFYNVQLTLQA